MVSIRVPRSAYNTPVSKRRRAASQQLLRQKSISLHYSEAGGCGVPRCSVLSKQTLYNADTTARKEL